MGKRIRRSVARWHRLDRDAAHVHVKSCNDVRYGSSGKLLKGYEARLLDEQGEPTPEAGEGNLWIKGDSAALYYWERSDATAETFVDGWVRTGDLYRHDADGYWFHMGRSDDCFKSSGQWVSPVEVEGVLLRHPASRVLRSLKILTPIGFPVRVRLL